MNQYNTINQLNPDTLEFFNQMNQRNQMNQMKLLNLMKMMKIIKFWCWLKSANLVGSTYWGKSAATYQETSSAENSRYLEI